MTAPAARRAEMLPTSKRRNTFALPSIGFVAPAVLLAGVVLYLPFLYTTYISFTKYNGLGDPQWVGLDNYVRMFSDPGLLNSLLNTLYWVAGTIVLPVGLGLFIAVLSHNLPGATLFRLPFLIPYALSGVAVGVIWSFVLQTDGALSQIVELFGADAPRWLLDAPLNTFVMIVASSWQGAGVNALLFGIGLQSIPKEPIEAAKVDGASGFTMFRTMTWPMLTPLTTVVVGLSIVGSLKTFDIVWGMTKGGPGGVSETLALTMYKETFITNDYGLGAAVAVFLTVVTVLASVLYLRRQLAPERSV
ncbi:carbohydrate ABC transporter permease [Pseudactinotalea terrae]|uniref:carbohydrate ABC transporter permease n=1 Tax=Pseudactinotalea terrae TaxID=1743262 RepID=UPI0012E293F8|nr:sugar ABC transporter permease [Pseudactinotalea terrae]